MSGRMVKRDGNQVRRLVSVYLQRPILTEVRTKKMTC